MANQSHNRKGFRPLGPNPRIGEYPIAASQTLAAGDAVILSSGQVSIGLAASAVLLGVVARDCASLAANTYVPVYDDPAQVFVGRADADSSSLVAGDEVDLVGGTGAMQLDADASTTDVFKLIRLHNKTDAAATAGAEWEFQINKHALAQID